MEDRDLVDAVLAEAVPIGIRRDAAGSYSADGKFTKGATVTQSILATVQPASGSRLQDLPEGIRDKAEFFLWTNSAVEADDFIDYGGKTYRILDAWPRPEGGFTKAVMGRTNDR